MYTVHITHCILTLFDWLQNPPNLFALCRFVAIHIICWASSAKKYGTYCIVFDVLIYRRDLVLMEYDWNIQSHLVIQVSLPFWAGDVIVIFCCGILQSFENINCSRMRFCAKRMGQDHRTALQTSKCNHSHSQTNSMNCRYFIILHPNQYWETHWKHLARFHLFEVLPCSENSHSAHSPISVRDIF